MQTTEGLVTWQVSTADRYDDHKGKKGGELTSARVLLIYESATGQSYS